MNEGLREELMERAELSRWKKAAELLDRLMDLPAEQQRAAIDELGEQHGIRAELEALYSSNQNTSVLDETLDDVLTLLEARVTDAILQLIEDADPHLPLILTAQYSGQPEIVRFLEEAGAEIDLFTACATGRFDVVREEIDQWPEDVNEYGRDGFTPLQLACYFGHEEIALWLLGYGADVNAVAQNGTGIAPIHAAAANGSLLILQALLAKGADVNARQQGGFTPLHTAAGSNSPEMARLFLEHGADRTLAADNGQTALDLALGKGHEAVVGVLRP